MKLVHTSDWHIGKSLCGFPLYDEQYAFLEELIRVLQLEQADCLVIAGDLFDRSVAPTQAVTLLSDALVRIREETGVPILAIAGNHDSGERLSFLSKLLQNSGVYLAGTLHPRIEPVILSDRFGEVHFYLLPYFEPAEVRALWPDCNCAGFDATYRFVLDTIVREMDPYVRNVIVTHGFFAMSGEQDSMLFAKSEVSIGGSDLINASCLLPFDYAALGHLHTPQRAGRDYIRYSGSPLKYSVSEAAREKHLVIADLHGKGDIRIAAQTIQPLHDVRILQGPLQELCSHAQNCEDYVYAILTDSEGDVLDPIGKLRAVYPRTLGLRFLSRNEASEKSTLSADPAPRKGLAELFENFVQDTSGRTLDKEEHALIESLEGRVCREAL